MGIIVGQKPIVGGGLVFCVDAANPRSYISGSLDTFNLINPSITGSIHNDVDYSFLNAGFWEFDGVDDIINPGTVFTSTTSKTLACWFNPSSFESGNTRHMVTKWNAGGSKRVIQLNMNNETPIFYISSNGSSFDSISYSTTITANNWYYLVGVFDDDNNKLKISLDGGNFVEKSYTAGMLSDSTTNLNIGGQNDDGSFIGGIAMAQIYNSALTAEEVLQNYNALKHRFQ